MTAAWADDGLGEHGFPPGFFARVDETADEVFYRPERMVTHIDDAAISGVGALYAQLGLTGRVLDLMSSWVSHFVEPPDDLVVLGMNARELAANPHAAAVVIADLNADPALPFEDRSFDAVTCCVSVDYLTRPIEVFREVHRVLEPGGVFVCTFSNRCFPTKAVRGWLTTDDVGRGEIVAEYFRRSSGWEEPTVERRIAGTAHSDPLDAVWSRTLSAGA